MDIWVAAAAAGAGYLAKYWKNVKGIQGLSEAPLENSGTKKSKFASSLSKNLDQKRLKPGRLDSSDRSFPFGRWVRRKSEKQTSSNSGEDETFSDTSCLDVLGSPIHERVPNSAETSEMPADLIEHEKGNILALSSVHLRFSRNENHQEDSNRTSRIGNLADISGCEVNEQANSLQVGMGYGFCRDRSSLHRKRCHGYSLEPRTSHERCAIAQLCKEYVELEEYDFSPFPSPARPIVRPLLMNDNQVTRNLKSSEDRPSLQAENVEHKLQTEDRAELGVTETLIGFPPSFEAGLVELQKKPKRRRGKSRQPQMSNTRQCGEQFPSQGSPNGAFLFCLGFGIGSMSTFLSNKSEVERLNELLRQAQNLAEDLQEELEMKDTLTVKELAHENCKFQEIEEPSADIKEAEEEEDLESMSKIEAELEAELARLELNANTSVLERESDFNELDPEFFDDIVHGELKADNIDWAVESDQDAFNSSTTHVHPTNYAVSSRELSLRLHELIQSRLEERISELESALEDSQKQLCLMETDMVNSQRGFSSSEIGSLSTDGSPTMMEHANSMSPPMFLNLSYNSSNSYDEAYVEFTKMAETKKENSSKQINGKETGPYLLDHIPCCDWADNGENGSLLHLEMDKMKPNEIGESDNDISDDELGKLLIKRLVEKTRQGSPIVLNAQRMLFSMDQ